MRRATSKKTDDEVAAADRLRTARDAFNSYMDTAVKPLLGLYQHELDRMRFAEIGVRVRDPDVRREYRDRAIALLEANIESSSSSAKQMAVPESDEKFVIASSLFVAAIAYRFGPGVFAALTVSAIWYWLAADASSRNRKGRLEEVRQHNEEAPEWAKTIADWNSDLLALRLLE